jgi:hypothetical protein
VLYLGTDLDAGFVVSAVDPGPAVDATDLRRFAASRGPTAAKRRERDINNANDQPVNLTNTVTGLAAREARVRLVRPDPAPDRDGVGAPRVSRRVASS